MTATDRPLQPLLSGELVLLRAPTQVWSSTTGILGEQPIHGVYHSDTRVLSALEVRVNGARPEAVSFTEEASGRAVFTSLLRADDDASADPKLRLDHERRVSAGSIEERFSLISALPHQVDLDIEVRARAEFAVMHDIKAGLPRPAEDIASSVGPTGAVRLESGSVTAELRAPGADVRVDGADLVLRWRLTLPARGAASVGLLLTLRDDAAVVAPATGRGEWSSFVADSSDPRLVRWAARALDDLDALRMTTTARPDLPFLAAGAPWFFTLFGRDSLWAARLLLPFGTDLAGSTLELLASLQGSRHDPATAEQPGKIMHELRATTLVIPGENVSLPPLYYGTVDATPLWCMLLHDAWRAGLDEQRVRSLLPAVDAAVEWMRDAAALDGTGFLRYVDESGTGLANQGWKDSGDSIQWHDGRLAEGPIALCEVQGYAHLAALGAADLFDAFGRPGADDLRRWAADLRRRFAETFWVDGPLGRHPAVALDRELRPVDSLTSNIGHLLGTGILDRPDAERVADLVTSSALSSGFGLRTLSTLDTGYWPLSYHGGSVWTHDTAIVIDGLLREGMGDRAEPLVEGLLAAAEAFGHRLPELHSGDSAGDHSRPAPYPSACRPQAWSAAAVATVLRARGLLAD